MNLLPVVLVLVLGLASALCLCADAFVAPPRTADHSSRAIASATVIFNNDRGAHDGHGTSVGDVVQHLHGGKYQFSDSQYLAGGSWAGRQFAESLYSGGNDDDGGDAGGVGAEDTLPKWARRLRQYEGQSVAPVTGTLVFGGEPPAQRTITIENEERSWERYHAFVLPDEGCFLASPATGTLAPRGGASNVCDGTKPYSDGALITVSWSGAEDSTVAAGGEERLLVVGTEAEVWRYRLFIT